MNTHQHRDFRSLDENTQAELRRLAFRMKDNNLTNTHISQVLEVRPETLSRWLHNRSELERRDCRGLVRGRSQFEQRILTKEQEELLQRNIIEKTPQELGLHHALWNRRAIKHCIERLTKTPIRLETVSKYTKRWGLTPQRPAKYAAERNEERISHWLETEYPKIVEEAKEHDAEIHWEDETGVALSTFYARSYAPSGKTPAIKLQALKGHISMISSISNRGDLRFMIYKGALDVPLFITFLEKLVEDSSKTIYLIVDNLRVHKAKLVQQWVQEHSDRLKIFFPTTIRTTT